MTDRFQQELKKYRRNVVDVVNAYEHKAYFTCFGKSYNYWTMKNAFDALAKAYDVEVDQDKSGYATDCARFSVSWETINTPEFAVIFISGGELYILANDEQVQKSLLNEFKKQGLKLRKKELPEIYLG